MTTHTVTPGKHLGPTERQMSALGSGVPVREGVVSAEQNVRGQELVA